MHTYADKTPANNRQSSAHVLSGRQAGIKSPLQFVDNRPQAIAQRKLQQLASNSAVVQRHVDVIVQGSSSATKKVLAATGDVEDFKDGTDAGDQGWLGVNKYRARYKVTSVDGKYENEDAVGPLKNVFTEANRGHVLAKRNGGDGTDEENVFAQDGGANNGTYKSFEARMGNMLKQYNDDDEVTFVCYLEGDYIYQGDIADAAESEASSISSADMDSDSD
ncbi:hypothetical protein [Rheinheimera pleomorphica]|uniref:hypothetical protein n=1 Tax=Rheinheimera pleomorphica TaxID=2703963 RepID=UPI001422A5BA|nr:hypothetical protein [Rheinheimera pleomorphica]